MRFELYAILWVTAVAAGTSAVFYSPVVTPIVSSSQLGSMELVVSAANVIADDGSGVVRLPRQTYEVSPEGARDLFRFDVVEVAEPPAQVPEPAIEVALPVLRGIVSDGGATRAMFLQSPSDAEYRAVAVGEHIGDYEVTLIGPDRVVAATRDGTAVEFSLRGAGEHP